MRWSELEEQEFEVVVGGGSSGVGLEVDFERERSLEKPTAGRTGEPCVNVTTGMTSN